MTKITYNHETVPHDKEVWACAFDIRNDGSYHALLAKPYRCKVVGESSWSDKAVPLKSNSCVMMKSGIVYAYGRKYADTYEECCTLFNKLIKEKQTKLEAVIDSWDEYYIND